MITNRPNKAMFLFNSIFFSIVFSVALSIFVYNYVQAQEKVLKNKIYPNVFIDNQNVGRLSKKDASVLISSKYKKLNNVKLTIKFEEDIIATMSAKKINLSSDTKEIVDRAYLIGRVPLYLPRLKQRIFSILSLEKYNFYTSVKYNKREFDEFISLIEEKYNKPAKNALFQFENQKVVNFRPEAEGISINADKFLIEVERSIYDLKKAQKNIDIKITKTTIKPEITLAESNKFGIEELIGEGISNYSHSIPERIHNVILASSKFNGILLQPGKEFSFNEVIGDISAYTGYKPAYIIKAGKTVLGDGGGVCQVSTTLFRAALNSGLPITERTAHAYRVSYYEQDSKPGFDATVYAPTVDLKFKNDTENYILIQSEIDQTNNILTFKFYGKKDNRKIEISDVKLYDEQPPLPESRQDDPTLRRGIVKQVDFPAWGAKAVFTYKVTKNDAVTFEKEFYSAYRPWQAVYLVGIGDF